MEIEGFGTSIVVALAAFLWLVYLVPTWLRRREYLSTERNAVRLQQTLRIMAETAEVPRALHVEASTRAVAEQQRAVRTPEAARTTATSTVPAAPRAAHSSQAARRLRRSRAVASLVLLAALAAAAFGLAEVAATGGWALLAASFTVAVGAVAMLQRMAAVARARAERAQSAGPVRRAAPIHDDAEHAERTVADRGWMPVPVPKPLYLSAPAPHTATATESRDDERADEHVDEHVDHQAALLEAAAASERALREAHAATEVARIPSPPPAEQAPSRFARMGIIDAGDAAPTDLDEILRRRRAV